MRSKGLEDAKPSPLGPWVLYVPIVAAKIRDSSDSHRLTDVLWSLTPSQYVGDGAAMKEEGDLCPTRQVGLTSRASQHGDDQIHVNRFHF